MSTEQTLVEHAEAIAETAKALLVIVNGKNTWVPKSVVGDDSEVYKNGHTGKLYVARWFAVKVGWGDGDDDDERDQEGDESFIFNR